MKTKKKSAFVNILLDFWSIVVTVASFVSHSQINNNKSKCAKILYFHRPVVRTNCPLNDTRKWIQREQRVYWRLSSLPWSKKSSKAIWLTDLWQYRAIIRPNVLFTFVMGLYTMGSMLLWSRIFVYPYYSIRNFLCYQKILIVC